MFIRVSSRQPVTLSKRRLWLKRFSVNFANFLWTLILNNTCEHLLLNVVVLWVLNCWKYVFYRLTIYILFFSERTEQFLELFRLTFRNASQSQAPVLIDYGPLWSINLFNYSLFFVLIVDLFKLLENCCRQNRGELKQSMSKYINCVATWKLITGG